MPEIGYLKLDESPKELLAATTGLIECILDVRTKTQQGHNVLAFTSIKEATDVLSVFKVTVLCVEMPYDTRAGLEALSRLKANIPNTIIIAITAHPDLFMTTIQAGACICFVNAFASKTFITILEILLATSSRNEDISIIRKVLQNTLAQHGSSWNNTLFNSILDALNKTHYELIRERAETDSHVSI